MVIDRPKGSQHPHVPDKIYPLDYGYLEGTTAADRDGIDVWIGSLHSRAANAVVVTIDEKEQDAEIKILLGCTEREMQLILDFTNTEYMQGLLVRRQNQVRTLLRTRRSVRRFTDQDVPRELIERLLEAAVQAPSAHNRQPWRFVILQTQEVRARVVEAMGQNFLRDLLADGLSKEEAEAQVKRSRQRILEAPVAILLCFDPSDMDIYPDPNRQQAEDLMGIQSVAMAGENLLLAAHAEGLGGVWICAPLFAPETVRKALELPDGWQPQGLLLLGYPARVPEPRSRRPLEEVVRYL